MIKAVVFDIGGVLIRDPWEWMLLDSPDNIAKKFGLLREDVLAAGGKIWEKYDRITRPEMSLFEQEKEWWTGILSALPAYPDGLTEEYLIGETERYLEPIEPKQIRELLDFLVGKRVVLGICSNNTDFLFAREWNRLGLGDYFPENNIVLSNKVGFSKSSEGLEMFHALKDRLGCEFNEMIFVDDRKHNIDSAGKCGINGIHMRDQSPEAVQELQEELIKRLSC
jgi:HAD superfamily hydrolase (TIGR01509 family)